jgi:hypothetical protein
VSRESVPIDLVVRLRDWDTGDDYTGQALLVEAADEIEKLRNELAGYRRWASSVNEALNTGDGAYRP